MLQTLNVLNIICTRTNSAKFSDCYDGNTNFDVLIIHKFYIDTYDILANKEN